MPAMLKICNEIGGSKWVVKAQVHAGGRIKSGGVYDSFAREWLGKRLVTLKLIKKVNLLTQY